MTDEEYVRNSWEAVRVLKSGDVAIEWIYESRATRIRFNSMEAAAAFTRERGEQIRQVEEEIGVLTPFWKGRTEEELTKMPVWAKDTIPVLLAAGKAIERILAREQAALAELKRGMK